MTTTPIYSLSGAHKANPTYFPSQHRVVAYGLQLTKTFHATDHGAYFVTSIKRKRGDKRLYQVRFVDGLSGRVVLVQDNYETNYGAQLRAKREAENNRHGCMLCKQEGHSPSLPCVN